MEVLYLSHITRADVKNNPHVLFIFGDNDERKGYGGQAAEMRGEPNARGIRVKKSPSMNCNAFYSDKEYDTNIHKIMEDLGIINILMRGLTRHYEVIVIPANGVGTGLASLNEKAPRTFKFLCDLMRDYGYKNGVI